ncbi:hypothetical protein BLNAU_18068 [Blattamonas nauphoetae]|uniref:Uncharacterized protein n=1 Tax=Blattamonas nauphoetae TaxID=2049346 RepID=A0ABQ9X5C8_9EUKA|nr:hypothetical protein BLNAU_18068 [Blattamonas nauphoetae]
MFFQTFDETIIQSHTPDSDRIFIQERETFLNFDPNSKLTVEDKSAIYNSLVALVKAGYPFDNALQDRAARFLRILVLSWDEQDVADKLVAGIVPSSAGSPSGFVESWSQISSPRLYRLFNLTHGQ